MIESKNERYQMTTVTIQNNTPFEAQYPLTTLTVVMIETQNGYIHVHPSDDNHITIKANASHFDPHATIDVVHNDGQFKFKLRRQNGTVQSFNNMGIGGVYINMNNISFCNNPSAGAGAPLFNTFTSIQSPQLDITAYVPASLLSHIQLVSSNGDIEIAQFEQSHDRIVKLVTSNSHVMVDHVSAKTLDVTTSNDSIDISDSHGDMTLKTSNAKVTYTHKNKKPIPSSSTNPFHF